MDEDNSLVTSSTCSSTLVSGGNCTITATRTVQPGDPDPLVNMVTVSYNPAGFSNLITDTDDHSVSVPSGCDFPPDPFEPNDSLSAAANLGVADQSHSGLTIHSRDSDDWYKWNAAERGTLQATIAFAHSDGDLDLQIYRAEGTLIAVSDSLTDNEQLQIDVEQGRMYFVRVFGFNGACHPNYSLSIDGPEPIPPTVEIEDVVAVLEVEMESISVRPIEIEGQSVPAEVDEIMIQFSEAVKGFDLDDLTLTHTAGSSQTVDWVSTSATLTTSDNIHFLLGNVGELTSMSGVYELVLRADGSGITDLGGNPLANDSETVWYTRPGDADFDGDFDQFDVLHVLIAGKYAPSSPSGTQSSGGSVTWSEGDWNNNGVFDQHDLMLALATGTYMPGTFASARPADPDSTSLALAISAERLDQDVSDSSIDSVFAEIGRGSP